MPSEYKLLHNIADAAVPRVKLRIVGGIEAFQNDVSVAALQRAVEVRNAQAALDALEFSEFKELSGIREIYQDAVTQAGKKHIERTFPKILQPKIRFDTSNPRIAGMISRNTAELVTNLTDETRNAVKDAIKQATKLSFEEGLPPRKSAELMRDVIGLNKPQEQAVFNFRRGLVEQGDFTPAQIERQVKALIERKLDERALLIARTETINAVNAGQQEVWNQAREDDLIDKDTKKQIIVTPDDRLCPICANPKVDGQIVQFDKSFTVWLDPPSGNPTKFMTPTFHPRCRCAMRMIFK